MSFMNDLGINSRESIFNSRILSNSRISSQNTTSNIEVHLARLLAELSNRTNVSPTPNTTQNEPTNSSGDRVAYRVSSEGGFQPTLPESVSSRINFPEFDEMVYMYHRNMLEYNYTIQQLIDGITNIRTRTLN